MSDLGCDICPRGLPLQGWHRLEFIGLNVSWVILVKTGSRLLSPHVSGKAKEKRRHAFFGCNFLSSLRCWYVSNHQRFHILIFMLLQPLPRGKF